MAEKSWLPSGFRSPSGAIVRRRVACGDDWQIFDCGAAGKLLVVEREAADGWVAAGLMPMTEVHCLSSTGPAKCLVEGGAGYRVESTLMPEAAEDQSEAEAFAAALGATMAIAPRFDTSDAVYLERLSRVLPTSTLGEQLPADRLLGMFLTGGVDVSSTATRRIVSLAPWVTRERLELLNSRLGIARNASQGPVNGPTPLTAGIDVAAMDLGEMTLAGRPELEAFFNEHVVDLIRHGERYERLGVGFPGAILLHGPPGGGKTYAVEQLVNHLGWPCLSIDCGSIGSPYIHETGRKIAATFEEAAKVAPAVVVIDEIDAFLGARDDAAGGQHRVEEVSEFLRRIPEAARSRVLVIGMTNRLASLDPAVVRRGRFDHILEVGMPSQPEVAAALTSLLSKLPTDDAIDIQVLAMALSGRPLSDASFVVRDSCRRAARRGSDRVAQGDLQQALDHAGSRIDEPKKRKIGFV